MGWIDGKSCSQWNGIEKDSVQLCVKYSFFGREMICVVHIKGKKSENIGVILMNICRIMRN